MLSETQRTGPAAAFAARILDAAGEVVGAGFVVGPRQVATCAHVVSAVLGGSPEDPEAPTGRLRVDLPLLAPPYAGEAQVRTWRPIDPATGGGDVAILELDGAPVGIRLPPLYRPDRQWGHRFRVLGFPAGMQDGVWVAGELRERQGTRWLQLERDLRGPSIGQGFSGAPVWDEEVEAVVGMTVASDLRPDGTTAYLLPIEDVLGVDPRLLPNPYRGLEPFGEEHADVFYGREDEVHRLEALLDRQPIVAVVGRSGTGKSSLVRAGLLPRMRRRGVGIVELLPRPPGVAAAAEEVPAALDRLLDTLDPSGPGGQDRGRLVFADQFEELVGAVPVRAGPTPAQQVLRRLVDGVRAAPALPDGAPSLRVVLTLRWEAMNELLTDEVVETFEEGTFSLAAMSRSQLRLAIVGPAARAPGLDFEPGLVERILDDAVAEPGQLPLVESLLSQLWASRRGGTLTSAAYDGLGGVTGAIARHAEQAFGEIARAGDGASLRRLLTALARPDDGTGFVRRPARFEALPSDQQRVVEGLARSRLLVEGQEADGDRTVELAHQALIDHWPRLRGWLDEDREFLLWQHEVDRRRQDWERAGHDRAALLGGTALARATEWSHQRGHDLPPPTRSFLDASRGRERHERRRHRALLAAGAIAVALVLVLATAAIDQRRDARREAATSASRSLATLSADTADADPALSMLQALAAYAHQPTPEAERALFRLYVEYRDVEAVLTGAQGAITYAVASSEAEVIAAMTALDRVTVWVRRPGHPVALRQLPRPRSGGRVASIAVSPSGNGVLVAESTRAWYYDVASGKRRWELPVDGDVEVAWLRDDGTVVLSLPGADSDRLEVWEPRGDRARRVAQLTTSPGVRTGLHGFGPGRDTVVMSTVDYNVPDLESVETRLQLWNTRTDQKTTVAGDDTSPTLAPDGRTVAACHYTSGDDTLGLIDLRDGSERAFDLPPGVDCTTTTAVGAGNDVVVTANGQLLLDLRSGETTVQPSPLDDDPPFLVTAVWKEGDRHLVLAHDQTRLVIRALATDDELVRGLPGTNEGTTDVAASRGPLQLSPDGERVVAVLDSGRTLAVSPTTARGIDFPIAARADRPGPRRQPSVLDLAISPDSSLVADRVAADRVQVRRLPDLELVSDITTAPVPDEARATAFVEFTGGRLLTSDGTHLEWWNPDTGAAIDALDLAATGTVPSADAASVTVIPLPDPSRLALVDPERDDVRIIAADSGQVVDTIPVGRDVLETRFQRDNHYFAVHRRGGLMEVWDADQRRRVVGPVIVPEPREGDPLASPSVVLGAFLTEPGSFLLAVGATEAQGAQLRWYQAGTGLLERTLDLGGATDLLASGPQPLWFSADGNVVLLAIAPSTASLLPGSQPVTLDLRPKAWQGAICGWLEGRRFIDAELATLPDGTDSLSLC